MLPLIVEPEALQPLLDDDRLLLVDICRDEIYQQQHLPGAVHISPSELISGVQPSVGKLPTLAHLEALFARIGYTPDKHIVVYDDEGGGWAGRFIWTLDVIGHQGASYLNGGLVNWASEQRPMTSQASEVAPTEVSLTINPKLIAEKEEVLASLNDSNSRIWDARSAEEYAGTRVASARSGHIPGAVNLDWLELMDREAGLKLPENLSEIVSARGFTKEQSIITHCQTHHRSGLTYLVGKHLGFNIKAYHGSWSEWGNDPDVPIENPNNNSSNKPES
jgi:thiosulfate/3-mercaptopyruvate sulfurtransferase